MQIASAWQMRHRSILRLTGQTHEGKTPAGVKPTGDSRVGAPRDAAKQELNPDPAEAFPALDPVGMFTACSRTLGRCLAGRAVERPPLPAAEPRGCKARLKWPGAVTGA
jgi:hypothetical protein